MIKWYKTLCFNFYLEKLGKGCWINVSTDATNRIMGEVVNNCALGQFFTLLNPQILLMCKKLYLQQKMKYMLLQKMNFILGNDIWKYDSIVMEPKRQVWPWCIKGW